MCEASVFLMEGDNETLVMEAVDSVETEGDKVRLMNIFGEQKILPARIHALFMVDNRILLKAG